MPLFRELHKGMREEKGKGEEEGNGGMEERRKGEAAHPEKF